MDIKLTSLDACIAECDDIILNSFLKELKFDLPGTHCIFLLMSIHK